MISGFVALKLSLQMLNVYSNKDVLAIYDFGPFWKAAFTIVLKVLAMSPVTAYIAPVFIWIVLVFRRDDLKPLAGLTRSAITPKRKEPTARR